MGGKRRQKPEGLKTEEENGRNRGREMGQSKSKAATATTAVMRLSSGLTRGRVLSDHFTFSQADEDLVNPVVLYFHIYNALNFNE
jgi:hypothetical protein